MKRIVASLAFVVAGLTVAMDAHGGEGAASWVKRFDRAEGWAPAKAEAGFEVFAFKDGVLRLVDGDAGKANQRLAHRLPGADLKALLGKAITFSAQVRLAKADRAESVGLAMVVKTRGGDTVNRGVYLGETGTAGFVPCSLSLTVPPDAATVWLYIDCANGYGRTAEAEFKDIALRVVDAGKDGRGAGWNRGAGTVFKIGSAALPWSYRDGGGVTLSANRGRVTVAARPDADGEAVLAVGHPAEKLPLSGDFTKAHLTFTARQPDAFTLEWISYDRKNGPVEVDPSTGTADAEGGRVVAIPLDRFAPPDDLVFFEGLVVRPKSGTTVVLDHLAITGLDRPVKSVNLLGNASFEEGAAPLPGFQFLGEYDPESTSRGVAFDTAKAFDGRRSLRVEPGGFFTWHSMDLVDEGAVFSIYAATPEGVAGRGEVELALQHFVCDDESLLSATTHTARAAVGAEWARARVATPEGPVDKSVRAADVQYDRIVVRNVGDVPVLLDAAQMELGTRLPGPFSAERQSRFHARLPFSVSLERYVGMPVRSNAKAGTAPLSVVNPGPLALSAVPVRGGVPFAKDELFDTAGVRLLDADGRPVPAQFHVLARRPVGGSVISLLACFQADLPAGGRKDFTLSYGPPSPAALSATAIPPLAVRRGDEVAIKTGALDLTLTPKASSLIAGGMARCVVETLDGTVHAGPAEIVEIVENGPEACLVFLRGTSLFAWELRIAAYRGKPYVDIDYTFERNVEPDEPLHRRVRAIYLQLPGAGAPVVHLAGGGEPLGAGGGGEVVAVQRHAREGLRSWNVLVDGGGAARRIDGAKLSGRARSGTAEVFVAEMAEMAPRALAAGPNGFRVYQWPDRGVSPLDVPSGFAATARVRYAPAGGLTDADVAARPLLRPDPDWIAASGVFGLFIGGDALREKFPKLDANLRAVEEAIRNADDLSNLSGLGDYGDFGSRNFYSNHQTALVQHLWTQYLRTGRADDFAVAEAHTRHQRDVDQFHARRGAGGVHPHYPLGNVNYRFHTGHFWLTGQLWHYYLTGDHRTLECSIATAAQLLQKARIRYDGGRERHRLLLHLAELYELTGNPEVRKAFERHYDFGGVSDKSAYYGGLSMACLEKLYEVTGDERYRKRMMEEADAFGRENADLPPMPEDRSADPRRTGYQDEGRGWMAVYAGAHLAGLTGDAKRMRTYERDDMDPLLPRMVGLRSRDGTAEWSVGWAAALARFGLAEPAELPDALHFTNRFTGYHQLEAGLPFHYRLTPDADGRVVLDVYRQRRFRYWRYGKKDDHVTAKLTAADGAVLAEATLFDNVTFEHRRLTAKSPDGGPVFAEVFFRNDAQGGVSSPNPIAVRGDRWFGARAAILLPYAVPVTAPANGRLTLRWRWANAKNAMLATTLGARFDTPEGETVAAAHYTVPLDRSAEKVTEQAFEITIPEAHRGKPLRLWLTDPKWVEWRLEGSDSPWLGWN